MIRQLTVHQVKAKLDAGEPLVFVDVRQPEEYAICRLPGGILIPLGELQHRAGDLEVPNAAAVVVYCHHGVRSLSGAYVLQQAGFEDVASMAGGIDAWSALVDPTVPRY